MDYFKKLQKENSKQAWQAIANHIGNNKTRLDEFMKVFYKMDNSIIKGASQVVGVLGEKQPKIMQKHAFKLVDILAESKIDAVKRNILRLFNYMPITPEIESKLLDLALKYLLSNTEAHAIRVFSMTILRIICQKHPELKHEIKDAIELVLDENKAASIQSRGKKELILITNC